MTNNSTESKRMMVHTYRGGEYISTDTYPSIVECKKELRARGYHFKNVKVSALDDMSETFTNGDEWVEVEEMREEDKWLFVDGRVYLPLSEWSRKHGMTDRVARYAFGKGRLPGLRVGRKNYLYLEEPDEE